MTSAAGPDGNKPVVSEEQASEQNLKMKMLCELLIQPDCK